MIEISKSIKIAIHSNYDYAIWFFSQNRKYEFVKQGADL